MVAVASSSLNPRDIYVKIDMSEYGLPCKFYLQILSDQHRVAPVENSWNPGFRITRFPILCLLSVWFLAGDCIFL
jgi:hypothetical protein